MSNSHTIKMDYFELIFNDVPHGKNKGLEIQIHDGATFTTRLFEKDEIQDLITYLVKQL